MTSQKNRHIISLDVTNPPDVGIQENSEQFGPDSVTLNVEWTQENSHLPFHYDINILPPGAIARFIDNTCIEIIVPYNVSFNVNVTTSLCDLTFASTIFTLPVYARAPSFCNVPVIQPNVQATVNHNQLLIEGSILNFLCLSELILSGPNTTICHDNGQWAPNPDLVKCKGLFIK